MTLSLAVSIATSCGSPPNPANSTLPPIDRTSAIYPFSVVEPETYSCKIRETVGSNTRTYLSARKGDRTRIDIDHGQPNQITIVHDGRTIRLDHKTKTYTQSSPSERNVPEISKEASLFRTMLFDLERAKFEKVGVEANLTKYRVSTGGERNTERFVYVDENVGFPMRVEIISVNGDVRTEVMRIEVSDLTKEVDDSMFAIPSGFSAASTR